MKKVIIGIVAILVLFLSGCDQLPEILKDYLPALELNGEIDVTIGLNEEYVDPGVELVGDFDLEITTDSNLDITTYGIYFIDYSVDYNGKEIRIGRKIRVVPETEKDFNINLSVESIDPNALTFLIEIDDQDGDLIDGEGILYYLDEKIKSFPVANGMTYLEFDELANQTYYRLEFIGSYTDNELVYTLDDYTIGAKTTLTDPKDYPRLELVGEEELHLNVGDEYIEQGVTIIGEQQELEITIESDVDTAIAGTYTVRYIIVFNLASIYAHRTVIVDAVDVDPNDDPDDVPGEVDFGVVIELVDAEAYSLTISVTVDDATERITNPLASLYLGSERVSGFVYSHGTTTITFEGLLAETTYHFILDGFYLSDGNFVSIGDYTEEFSTLPVSDIVFAPYMVLNGDSIVEVEINTPFVDPGASVIGYPNAVITQSLYPNIVGTYTITYSATIDGVPFNVTRTINVVDSSVQDNYFGLTSYEIGKEYINVVIDVEDAQSEIVSMTAYVYDIDGHQANISGLLVGNNEIMFDWLTQDTNYKLVVEYSYIPTGESDTVYVELELLDFNTLAAPRPILTSIDCSSTGTQTTCSAEWNEEGFESNIIYSAELWSGTNYIGLIRFTNDGTVLFIDDLNPDSEYTIKVFADYTVTATGASYIVKITEFEINKSE